MQGGYEPRGSRGPGRGVYLVRRAVFIAVVIVLVAFVLPRACGVFSEPDTSGAQRTADEAGSRSGASGSGGETGASSGGATTGPAPTTTASGTGGDVESAGSTVDAGGEDEDAVPATIEETLAEEPREVVPTGIPTRNLSDKRARGDQRERAALIRRLEPPMKPLAALPLLPEPERTAAPERVEPAERVQQAPEPQAAPQSVAAATAQQTATRQVVVTQPAGVEPASRRARVVVAEPVAGPTAQVAAGNRRVASTANNAAYAGGGADDGGRAAQAVTDARRDLVDVTPAGGARAAVRGALRDAGTAVGAAEDLGAGPVGKDGRRCAKNPNRCANNLLR